MRALCIALLIASTTAAADPKLAANLEVPTVTRGLDKVPAGRPTVLVTTKGIVVDGKSLATISEGNVDPSEKQGGALGIEITRLAAYVQKSSKLVPPSGYVLAFDKSLPYHLMIEVMYSIKKAGIADFGIMAHASDLGVVPVKLPTKTAAVLTPSKSDPPLGIAVAITKDRMIVWSTSGLEGTLAKPKLAVARTDVAKVTAALAEIVKRRFATRRADADRSIIVLADGNVPLQDIVSAMIAVRSDATGAPLFPDIQLSSGFTTD